MKSESINELAAALAKAQAEIQDAEKTRKNPHLKNSYATLAAVWDACRTALASNGLSVVQGPDGDVLVTMLAHASGQWVETRTPILYASQKGLSDAQAYGAALTYARRYALSAIVGVAQEDDDGNSAGRREPPAQRPPERPQAAPPAPGSAPRSAAPPVPAGSLGDAYVREIVALAEKFDAGQAPDAEEQLREIQARVKGLSLPPAELDAVRATWRQLMDHVQARSAA